MLRQISLSQLSDRLESKLDNAARVKHDALVDEKIFTDIIDTGKWECEGAYVKQVMVGLCFIA